MRRPSTTYVPVCSPSGSSSSAVSRPSITPRADTCLLAQVEDDYSSAHNGLCAISLELTWCNAVADAPLTELGREQCTYLCKRTLESIQQRADLVVSSPLRRTMTTTLIGYSALLERLRKEHPEQPTPILLPLLQERNSHPCDTGSEVEVLQKDPEFAHLDYSTVEKGWNSKTGIYAPENCDERARLVRRWLLNRPEKEIVVVRCHYCCFLRPLTRRGQVAHGDILRHMLQDQERPLGNTEVVTCKFAPNDPEDASLIALEAGTEASV